MTEYAWPTEPKKSLTPDEVLAAAYAALIAHVHQHHIAASHGVDSGRVAEAVVAMKWAAENHKVIYRHVHRQKKMKKVNGREEPLRVEKEDAMLRLALHHLDPLHPDNRGFDGPGGAE